MKYVFFYLILFLFEESTALKAGIYEKQQMAAYMNGDFIIGALLPVHGQPKIDVDPLLCGQIQEQYGILRIEAAFFAIDSINKDPNLLPNITLGINIRDDCSSEAVALYQVLKVIENPIPNNTLFEETSYLIHKDKDFHKPALIGFIGPSSSSAAIQVQNLLKLFRLPQIGFSLTAGELFDESKNPYFRSVIPSDLIEARVMLSILRQFNWTYVSLLYTDNEYGGNGKAAIELFGSEYGVCIPMTVRLPIAIDEEYFVSVFEKLSSDKKAKVVVCFCSVLIVERLMRAIKTYNYTGQFLFLGSESWGSRTNPVKNYKEQAWGSLTIGIDSIDIPEFNDYNVMRKPHKNDKNPWFHEFWEEKFNCTFNTIDTLVKPVCTGEEQLITNTTEGISSTYVLVIQTLYAFAHALHNMQTVICKNHSGLCSDLYPFNTTTFMEYLNQASFYNHNDSVSLIPEKRHIRYIYNYQKSRNGTFSYVQVGKYRAVGEEVLTRNLEVDETLLQFPNGRTEPVISSCASPCLFGQKKATLPEATLGKSCCWICMNCGEGEYTVNETTCQKCDRGSWPYSNKTGCYKVPEFSSHWTELQILLSYPCSILGILLTSITSFTFVKNRETPVVKASTRELCYMMLLGMLMSHCITFAFATTPNIPVCVFIRTVPGLSFTMIYSALLVKTNRIARILAMSKKKFPNLNPRFLSLNAQVTITVCLIAVEIVLCVIDIFHEPPIPQKDYHEPYYVKDICSVSTQWVVYRCMYMFLLVALCTMYAVKTRKLPQNFNEAKFIGFAMYVTCITFMAFLIVYYGSYLQIVTICVCSSLNALVILVFIFFPKLYIIIWMPHKNTRLNFTTSKGIRCSIGREDLGKVGNNETDFSKLPSLSARKWKSVAVQTESYTYAL